MSDRTHATAQRAPRTAWCWLCARATLPNRLVDTVEDGPVYICEDCWQRESPSIPLDMTEDEPPDINREGDPAFNGANSTDGRRAPCLNRS